MKNVQMPKWVAAFLVIATVASLMLAVFATSFTLVKPFTVSITTAPCPLSVTSINFSYDPSVNRWTSCTVQINNPTGSPVAATVYIYLKNNTQTVASGQSSQNFPAGNTVITINLSWATGATADDVTSGYVVIQP